MYDYGNGKEIALRDDTEFKGKEARRAGTTDVICRRLRKRPLLTSSSPSSHTPPSPSSDPAFRGTRPFLAALISWPGAPQIAFRAVYAPLLSGDFTEMCLLRLAVSRNRLEDL